MVHCHLYHYGWLSLVDFDLCYSNKTEHSSDSCISGSLYPGILNRMFGNRTQSNSIELMDWVRLSSAIERNRTSNFVWEIEPNRTQSIGLCSIGFGHRTQSNTIQLIEFDWVRLPNFFCVSSISFNFGNQSNSIHGLGSIEFDWVRLKFSSIRFDWLCRAVLIIWPS